MSHKQLRSADIVNSEVNFLFNEEIMAANVAVSQTALSIEEMTQKTLPHLIRAHSFYELKSRISKTYWDNHLQKQRAGRSSGIIRNRNPYQQRIIELAKDYLLKGIKKCELVSIIARKLELEESPPSHSTIRRILKRAQII